MRRVARISRPSSGSGWSWSPSTLPGARTASGAVGRASSTASRPPRSAVCAAALNGAAPAKPAVPETRQAAGCQPCAASDASKCMSGFAHHHTREASGAFVARVAHQLLRPALLDDAAFLHEQDTVCGLARKLHLVRHHRQGHAVGGSQTSTRTGVGLKPLQGLLTCGQLEITKITSMSAVTSTWVPPAEMPSPTRTFPEGSSGTFMKKLRLATMSRLARPYLESSRMRFSRQACWYFVASPKRTT